MHWWWVLSRIHHLKSCHAACLDANFLWVFFTWLEYLPKQTPKCHFIGETPRLWYFWVPLKQNKFPAVVGNPKYWLCPLVAFALQALHFSQGEGEWSLIYDMQEQSSCFSLCPTFTCSCLMMGSWAKQGYPAFMAFLFFDRFYQIL